MRLVRVGGEDRRSCEQRLWMALAFLVGLAAGGVLVVVEAPGAGPLWLGWDERRQVRPSRSVRIGLTKEVYRLLRFYERGNVYVSGPRKLCS